VPPVPAEAPPVPSDDPEDPQDAARTANIATMALDGFIDLGLLRRKQICPIFFRWPFPRSQLRRGGATFLSDVRSTGRPEPDQPAVFQQLYGRDFCTHRTRMSLSRRVVSVPRTIARVVLFALAVAAPAASGCFPGASCNCPDNGGFAYVTVPAAQSSPIAAVSATGRCTASTTAAAEVVAVSTDTVGGCQVFVKLTSGDTYTFHLAFTQETLHGACDCEVLRTTDGTAVPTLTDAGING
jgi:hypothetical protein